MKLPTDYIDKPEWTLIGPMGPELPPHLLLHPVLAVDGGAALTTKIDVWVGDSDSFLGEVKAPHIFRHPPVKDFSDLALAFELLRGSKARRIHLWGFLGGRKDHELFNLGVAQSFLKHHKESEIFFYDSKSLAFHFLGPGHWKFEHQGLFSIGCIEKTSFTLNGACQYTVSKMQELTPLSSFGLSNQARGEVTLDNQGPVFIYFPEGK
ncbi:MAG TPA: hypothetical protein VNJ08_01595 [Bacteriovoracaceae bacterium]|nr:hypothetical protein [Bacteriovoracaceae bacterium]